MAGEEDQPAAVGHELVQSLAHLRRQRLDVAQDDDAVIAQALLLQSLPDQRLGMEQRRPQRAARLQGAEQVERLAVEQRRARVAVHHQHPRRRHRLQGDVEAVVLGKGIALQAHLAPVQPRFRRHDAERHRHLLVGAQVGQLLADGVAAEQQIDPQAAHRLVAVIADPDGDVQRRLLDKRRLGDAHVADQRVGVAFRRAEANDVHNQVFRQPRQVRRPEAFPAVHRQVGQQHQPPPRRRACLQNLDGALHRSRDVHGLMAGGNGSHLVPKRRHIGPRQGRFGVGIIAHQRQHDGAVRRRNAFQQLPRQRLGAFQAGFLAVAELHAQAVVQQHDRCLRRLGQGGARLAAPARLRQQQRQQQNRQHPQGQQQQLVQAELARRAPVRHQQKAQRRKTMHQRPVPVDQVDQNRHAGRQTGQQEHRLQKRQAKHVASLLRTVTGGQSPIDNSIDEID